MDKQVTIYFSSASVVIPPRLLIHNFIMPTRGYPKQKLYNLQLTRNNKVYVKKTIFYKVYSKFHENKLLQRQQSLKEYCFNFLCQPSFTQIKLNCLYMYVTSGLTDVKSQPAFNKLHKGIYCNRKARQILLRSKKKNVILGLSPTSSKINSTLKIVK